MATDELTHGRAEPDEVGVYVSPAVDFLLLFGLTLLVAVIGASFLLP
jgi:hypothetical protein